MADVFVSYKRQDEAPVQLLVTALQGAGLTVWWDREIALDAAWELTIERELTAARVVIVAWSPGAVASDNVRAEARRARHAGKLIQVFLEHCDPPLFFGERQGVNLNGWRGNPEDHRFQAALAGVQALLAGKTPEQGVGPQPRQRRLWLMLAPVGVVGAAALGLIATAALTHNTGLVGAPPARADPAVSVAAQEQGLLKKIAGAWDLPSDGCKTPTIVSVATDGDGVSRITTVRAAWRRIGQVSSADPQKAIVFSRITSSTHGGVREEADYHPDGDELMVIDKDGNTTTLVRCGATA